MLCITGSQGQGFLLAGMGDSGRYRAALCDLDMPDENMHRSGGGLLHVCLLNMVGPRSRMTG